MDDQRTRKDAHEIIIVGAGPTGLALAAELALARCEVVVLERRSDQRVDGVRAGGLHSRTIELLDQRGIAERFLSQGQRAQLAGFARVALDASDLRTRHSYGLILPQQQVEQTLLAWARELGVRVERGVSVVDLEQREDRVEVSLSDGDRREAQFVVGCDGGRSVVRTRTGIEFVGTDAQTSYALAEVTLREEPAWGLRYGSAGVHAIAKMPEPGRARLVLSEPFRDQPRELTLDALRALMIEVYRTDFGLESASWLSRFTDGTRLAARYRDRRVLLAGDAAHVHSPIGGQGLNTGVHDAFNLGWKLARVVRGRCSDALLESYEAERRPVAAKVLRTTLAQSAIDRDDPRAEALRGALAELLRMDEPRRRYAAMMSGLDVRYELGGAHELVGRRVEDVELQVGERALRLYTLMHDGRGVLVDFGASCERATRGYEEDVRYVRARYHGAWELAERVAVPAPGALLVRPDGHVAWAGANENDELDAALARWFGAHARSETESSRASER